ncbi:MFS transporter, partial [Escherichia coli]|uniref:MFS transporter n=1 Tax=Escherichia coli TaxID=562 RepID=UPI00202379AC
MALNIPFRNAYYRFASSYSFLFFISWSLWWSLYAIWLKGHLGLTGTELGTLYSVNGFAPIFPDTCYHLTHYWPAAADIPV